MQQASLFYEFILYLEQKYKILETIQSAFLNEFLKDIYTHCEFFSESC